MSDQVWDAIVVGAGPAGSTTANLLARDGHRVLVIERETFPRFHVGESLLPRDLPLFQRLGLDPLEHGFLCKRGAQFIDERTGQSTLFSFDEGLEGTPAHAYQVDRASFDLWLLDAAQRHGATARQGERVMDVQVGDERVLVETEAGTYHARYFIDATGQDSFLARRNKTREPLRDFGKGAVFRRYSGLRDEVREELTERGDIIIKIVEDGWMWVIPLADGELSIGLVKKTGKVDDARFELEMEASPLLQRLTAGAACSDSHVVANFSYQNTRSHGARWTCVGDAAAFLDPVFSSGVTLAILGAERLADLLSPALSAGTEANPELMKPLSEHMQHAYDCFARFIQRFYHTNLVPNLFFSPSPPARMREGVISVLAGDVWRDDNPFQDMLLSARRGGAS
jgi:flavin-dependent dehydrogenase